MRNKNNILLSSIIMLFAFSMSWAQTTGKLAGVVYDGSNKEPLAGANVILENTSKGASTGLDGSFYIINVPPGSYNVQVQMIGYKTVVFENLRISVNRTATIEATLDPAIIEGDVIVVQANKIAVRKDQTSSMRTISKDQMDALPIENVGAVVAMQAGVVQGHFRGGRSGEVTYMVDGLQVDDTFGGSGKVVELETESIEDLEVVTGTFNAEYGRAMSGVVNAVTRDGGEKFEGSASIGLANYYTSHDNVFIGLKNSEINRNQDYKVSLSGPMFIPKLTFFSNLRYQDNKNHLNGIRRFKVDDFSDFSNDDPDMWISEHNGDGKYVPMNGSKNISFLGKLTYKLTDNIKTSLLYSRNDDQWNGYDHSYKYNPDGTGTAYRTTDMISLRLNHMVSKSAFYEAKVSYVDNYNGWYVYKNPLDSGYVHDGYGRSAEYTGFVTGGQQKGHSERWLKDLNAKLDFTWQVNRHHSLKSGVLFINHDLKNEWKEIRNLYANTDLEEQLTVDENGKIVYLNYKPVTYPDSSRYADIYSVKPYEFGAYLQDKIEYDDLVINFGLRFDYFNPNSKYPSDRRNPGNRLTYADSLNRMSSYPQTKPQTQLSPRIGLAYQLGKRANLHFSYGHFFQMPALYALFQNHSYWLGQTDYEITMGNSQLKAEKTVQYEIGLKQELMEGMIFDVVLYYRDIYDLLSVKAITTYNQVTYGLYTNKDYGNVKGLEFKFDYSTGGLFSSLNYTLQYTRGSADNPVQNFDREGNNQDPVNKLIPLSWDQRHTFNATVGYNTANWGATLTGYYNSGSPYTWTPLSNSSLVNINLYPNNDMMPSRYSLDFNGFYRIKLMDDLNVTFSLAIYNLLDTKNEVAVDSQTGRAYTSIVEETELLSHRSNFNDYEDRVHNPSMYSTPRMVKLTTGINF